MKRMNKHSLVKSRLGMGTVEVKCIQLYDHFEKHHEYSYISHLKQ